MTAETVVVHLIADATRFLTGLDAAASRLLAYTASLTASAARHGTMMATAFEKNTVAVQTMVKDMVAGTKLIEDLTDFAIETPFSSQEVVESAKQLKAFGFATQDVIPTLRALGNVSAGTGTSMERIILAFGQVRVAGKLMGTELRQFVDAGIPLIEELAKVMGKPVESIRLLTEQGQVGFNEVVQAFNNMNAEGGQFAGLMDVISRTTVSGRFQALSETLQVMARNFALAAFEGLGLKGAMDVVTRELTALAKNRDQSGIVAFFREVRTAVNAVVFSIRFAYESMVEPVRAAYAEVRKWVTENKAVLYNVLAGVAAVWTLYVAVKAVTYALIVMRTVAYSLAALSGVLSLVSSFVTLAAVVSGILSSLLTISAVVAPLVVITAELVAMGAFRFSGEAFQKGKAAILDMKDAWNELVDAVGRGDYENAIAVFTTGIRYAWKVLIITLKGEWTAFTRGLGAGWEEIKIGAGPAAKWGLIDSQTPLVSLVMKAMGKTQQEVDAALEAIDQLKTDEAVKLTAAVREAQAKAKKAQVEMMKGLLDPEKNLELKELKKALDDAVLKSSQAGIDQKATKTLQKFFEDNVTAVGQTVAAMGRLSKNWNGMNRAAAVSAFKIQGKTADDVIAALAGDSRLKITKDVENLLPENVIRLSEEFSKAMGLADRYLPSLKEMTQYQGQAFAQMAAPYGISGKARDVLNELTKELDKGVTSWEQEVIRLRAVNEAYFGSKFGQELGGAVGGFFAVANKGAMGGKMPDAVKTFEDFQRIQRLQKATGVLEYKPPPAALAGSQAAQDIINANLNQQLSVEQEILSVLIASKTEAQEQTKLQKAQAEAWDRLSKAGTIKALGME